MGEVFAVDLQDQRKTGLRPVVLSATAVLVVLALAKLLLHFVTSVQYGYFRDELYYIAASERLAFGYVDFPPFIAVVTAITRRLLGDWLFALHVFPALAGATVVLLTGLMARQLGGGRFAQFLAALAALVAPVFLAINSLLTMDSFDQLFWVSALYVLLLILKRDEARLWPIFGLMVGLGLQTKVTMLYLGAALVVALLLTSSRRYLLNKWLWIGGAIAFAFLLPYLLWQVANGWPTVEFWKTYVGGKTYPVTPVEFFLQQIVVMLPLTLPLTLAGLCFYLLAKEGKRYRPLGWIYVILYVVFTIQQAKMYFLAAAYPMLFAGGSVMLEQFIQRRGWNWFKPTYVAILLVTGVVMAPLYLPVLPVETLVDYTEAFGGAAVQSERLATGALPQHFADRFGWESMVENVAKAYSGLPPEEQAKSCIFADNYGEAGALSFFGQRYDLPPVISGHNSYFLWGPGNCTGEVIITVAVYSNNLRPMFRSVTSAGSTHCEYCMPYENLQPIYICRGSNVPLEELWPQVKDYE
jgi:4-amino-4-deoxy-L-arabinose transferase-like glycosyltransferase